MTEAPTGPPTRRTSRLLLRAPELADAEALFPIQSNAEAMCYTSLSLSLQATEAHLASYADRFEEDGFAPWTVLLEAPGADEPRIIGWGGLNKDPSAPEWGTEVAYYLDSAYWGRGLATELVGESLVYAFDDLSLLEVGAFVRPDNLASVRVLVKSGFERVRFVTELERDEYRIAAENWRTAR